MRGLYTPTPIARSGALPIAPTILLALGGGAWLFALDKGIIPLLQKYPPIQQLPISPDWLPVLLTVPLVGVLAARYGLTLRRAREAQHAVTNSHANLMACLDDPVFIFPLAQDGTPGRIMAVNPIACERLGYSESELLRLTLDDITLKSPEADPHSPLKVLLTDREYSFQAEHVTKKGTIFPVKIHARVYEHGRRLMALLVARDMSEGHRVVKALSETSEKLHTLMRAIPIPVVTVDATHHVTGWNAAAEWLFGWRKQDVFGRALPLVPEGERHAFAQQCAQAQRDKATATVETRFLRMDGTLVDVSVSIAPLQDVDGGLFGVMYTITDISALKQTQAELHWISNAFRLVSEARRVLAHSLDEVTLLRQVCEVISAVGGYHLAWVGYAENDQLRPVAWDGPGEGYIRRLTTYLGNSPMERALRAGIPVIENDLVTNPTQAPWLVEAINHGIGSMIALPLAAEGRTLGVLLLCANTPNAFTPAETELLTLLAEDLAYGIEAVRTRADREQADRQLVAAAQQWQSTFDGISDTLLVLDRNGLVIRGNEAALRLFGVPEEQLLHRACSELVHGTTDETPTSLLLAKVWQTLQTETELMPLNDRWYQVTVHPLLDGRGQWQGAIYVMDDVTEHRRADIELAQNYRRLQGVLDNTISAIAKIVEMRDPYTAGHEQRVCRLACAIAREMELPEEQIEGLRVASMMHDIGKLCIPSEILSKPSRLSDIEYSYIKNHAQAGYDILSTIEFPWPVANMVWQHHERMDGLGYPNGLSGDQILLESRILAVADVVESMASHRPYRPSRGLEEALSEITTKAGTHFDAVVVQACVTLFTDKGFTLE